MATYAGYTYIYAFIYKSTWNLFDGAENNVRERKVGNIFPFFGFSKQKKKLEKRFIGLILLDVQCFLFASCLFCDVLVFFLINS